MVALSLLLVSCAVAAAPARDLVTQPRWDAARARLRALRAALPERGYVEQVQVTLREPATGKVFDGRGAVAVEPHRAMRMILLGPGGTTALDVWVTPAAWRMVVPAVGLKKRGTSAPPGMPIGFFRWWFLAPLDGRLLTLDGDALVLRSGRATVEVEDRSAPGRRALRAARREGGSMETLEWSGAGSRPAPGDRARYTALGGRLTVDVVVESVSSQPATPEAFVDPDAPGGVP